MVFRKPPPGYRGPRHTHHRNGRLYDVVGTQAACESPWCGGGDPAFHAFLRQNPLPPACRFIPDDHHHADGSRKPASPRRLSRFEKIVRGSHERFN